MTLQPSYRQRTRSAVSPHRRDSKSEKVPAGSFIDSVKEVLDEVSSRKVQDVAPVAGDVVESQPSEINIIVDSRRGSADGGAPRSDRGESAGRRSSPRRPRGSDERELPASKRSRSDHSVRSHGGGSHASRGAQTGWGFSHSRPGSVIEDNVGMATLVRHMKEIGCSVPLVDDMTNPEDYLNFSHYLGKLANAYNKTVTNFEDLYKKVPDAKEVELVKAAFKETKDQLDASQIQLSEALAAKKDLEAQLSAMADKNEDLLLDLKVKSSRISALEQSKRTSESQVSELLSANAALVSSNATEAKRAARAAKKEVISAYQKVLSVVDDKFKKKKKEVEARVYAQELQANVDLLKSLITKEIASADAEFESLKKMLPQAKRELAKSQVSDLSLSKLQLPQVSESVELPVMGDADRSRMDEAGSNIGKVDVEEVRKEMAKGDDLKDDA